MQEVGGSSPPSSIDEKARERGPSSRPKASNRDFSLAPRRSTIERRDARSRPHSLHGTDGDVLGAISDGMVALLKE